MPAHKLPRLVASDIDGTLLRKGDTALPAALFDVIRALRAHGVLFCAASGRQYASLRKLFAPVADDILFACENGAVVFSGGARLAKTPLARVDAEQIINSILAQGNCLPMISGEQTVYIFAGDDGFLHHLRVEVGNQVTVIRSLAELQEDIVKVSAYCAGEGNSAVQRFPLLAPPWENRLNVAVAGERWVDFTLADKGAALAQIGALRGVPARDTMVFGDNYNDIPMFKYAGTAFAMASAVPAVQAAAAHICDDVTATLRAILASAQESS